MEFLASDALHGRGSATADEFTAATYIATELERVGVQPAGDDGGFLQQVPVPPKTSGETEPTEKAAGETIGDTPTAYTWNVIGRLPGRDPVLGKEVVLLSAHLDHLGTRPGPNGDVIYHGADDDASGVSAVLELARGLAQGARPRWLTGWNRTNLGPALAAHGAHLVADPHPAEDFFRRSDNFAAGAPGCGGADRLQLRLAQGLSPAHGRPGAHRFRPLE
jgi:hypothetical protein